MFPDSISTTNAFIFPKNQQKSAWRCSISVWFMFTKFSNFIACKRNIIWISTNDHIHLDYSISWNDESGFSSCWVNEGGFAHGLTTMNKYRSPSFTILFNAPQLLAIISSIICRRRNRKFLTLYLQLCKCYFSSMLTVYSTFISKLKYNS